jgi:hypothetical protein
VVGRACDGSPVEPAGVSRNDTRGFRVCRNGGSRNHTGERRTETAVPDRDPGGNPGTFPRTRAGGKTRPNGGKAPGERPPVTHSNRREDRRQAPTRGESSDADEAWCRSPVPTSRANPRPTSSGTHGCAQCESWVGACLRSASDSCGGVILMGQERFLALKRPAANRSERVQRPYHGSSKRFRAGVCPSSWAAITGLDLSVNRPARWVGLERP